jgi:hypothetical protein
MTTLEQQHATAYEILGTLLARGYDGARMELGGGGIAEVTTPLPDNKLTGYKQRLTFTSYVEDALFVEQWDGQEWLLVWELPNTPLNLSRAIWLQTAEFLDALETELRGAE